MTDNVNTSTGEDEDFYDDATSAFPSAEHLAPTVPPNFGEGRLVAIWAISNGEAKGNNGVYGYTETITLALDDGPDGDQANEMVPAAPFRTDMRHSTGYIHGKLKGRVTGKNAKGIPLRWRPLIGRVNTKASTNNKNVAAFGIAPKTDDDMVIVNRYKSLIIEINKELEAVEKEAENSDAFDA